jgi:outer membrane receptor protein involved in Fe transport
VIPSVPRHRIKAGFDYSISDAFKVGGDALFVSSQYFAGDGANVEAKLPPYTVFNVHASYQVDKNVQVYGRVDNLFDNRYATHGAFFDIGAIPNLSNGTNFTDARSVSPARPRAFYAGVKVTF